ncbi:MAG: tRNA uracil 4-sulfurtransferase ThiI [Nanoarchaeota archaeon]|nr:tRNA 4-thiouridine(8) synthase ThiI [Nanoarchaeota archaeon]
MKNIIVHYSEIGIKGKNRGYFENKLIGNLRLCLGKRAKKVYKRYGRIVCEIDKDDGEITEILERVPGVAYFCFSVKSKLDINDIKKKCFEILKSKEFKTFRVLTKRSNKNFEFSSNKIDRFIGEEVIKKFKKKVNLGNPELTLFIEVGEKEVFVYTDKIKGIGGLPVGVSGKVVCSLSGGIDSPVASYLMMKRGCKVVFVHIYNKTQQGVVQKIKDIVEQLSKFQINSKLYIVGFEKIQKQIIMNVPSKYRMIVYRRFMMKIINEIAKKENAKAVITGDSVGQVASQTIENLNCIYDASEIPVFAPLIGMNKQEIIDISNKIETYSLSILDYPDCCSFMIAKHPETKAELNEIKKIEKNIESIDGLVEDCVKGCK